MPDLNNLSDEELINIANGQKPASKSIDYDKMSDEQLMSLASGKVPEKTFLDRAKETFWGKLVMDAANTVKRLGEYGSGKTPTYELDPKTGEFHVPRDIIERSADTALLLSPGAPGRLTAAKPGVPGRNMPPEGVPPPAAAPPPPPAPRLTPVEQAGADLGVPVPRFLGTDSKAVQMAAQAGKQSPIGGPRIEQAAKDFLTGVESAVDRTAVRASGRAEGLAAPTIDEVGSGIRQTMQSAVDANNAAASASLKAFEDLAPAAAPGSRSGIGADIITKLEEKIGANKEAQDANYKALRALINPNAKVPVAPKVAQTLNGVMKARTAAGEAAIPRDLIPIMELATNPKGATFAGLQRARSTLAERIDFETGQGFAAGDLKQAYGALTEAMKLAVQKSAGSKSAEAMAQFAKAESEFARLSNANASLRGFTQSGPEALVDRLIQYASDRSGGNIEKLAQVKSNIPEQNFQQVSRHAFDKLSQGPDGQFSMGALTKNWASMSDKGKEALFGEAAKRMEAAIRGLSASTERMTRHNEALLKLMAGTDTQVANRLISMATSGAKSDIDALRRASTIFGSKHVDGLSSVVLQRLGQNQKGEFSGAFFEKNWNKLSDDGKAFLFSNPEVRTNIDKIMTLVQRENQANKYANSSQSGRVGVSAALGGSFFVDPITTTAAALGGDIAARILSKPKTAKAAYDWSSTLQKAKALEAKAEKAMINQATERFARIIVTELNLPTPANDVARQLIGATKGAAENNDQNAKRPSDH